MIPDEFWPLVWAPVLLGALLTFLAASTGAWKPATRKRLSSVGTAMLLGFGFVAVLLAGADAAIARQWVAVSHCVGVIGLAAWLGGEVQPWRVGPRLKCLGIFVFGLAGLWRVWLTYDSDSAFTLTLVSLGAVVAAVLVVGNLSRRKGSRTADAGQH